MSNHLHDSIAIIGMACRFPSANNLDEFWNNLRTGTESITFFSEQELLEAGVNPALLKHPNYVKANGILSDVDLFDAAFFDFNPKEIEIMDPQHRLFLECAWNALENAGYNSENYPGFIGIFGGCGVNTYLLNNLLHNPKLDTSSSGLYQLMIDNEKDFLTTRISYKLNLKGPSVTVQTGCSTSLVATHFACQSLLNNESDIALAGGSSIILPLKKGYLYQEGMILSPDGHCRTFDEMAQGTVVSSGVGIVVLKRLEDALNDKDHIYAVIRGSAINNDAGAKAGFTTPSIEGQATVIATALVAADVEPDTITYIEAHGTGTPIGDPIEIEALKKVFSDIKKKNLCGIGSVKTNLGHTDTASGICGLIKTVLALQNKQIPPSLHFQKPNPRIDFANSPFYVVNTLQEWKSNGAPLRAGVSSFGIGGTNVHIILEEAPEQKVSGSPKPQLLVLSARSKSALSAISVNLSRYLKQHPKLNLANVAYTLQVGRKAFGERRMLVCKDIPDAIRALDNLDPKQMLIASIHEEKRSKEIISPSSVISENELTKIGESWLQGKDIDWDKLHAHEEVHRVPLPTYPFERKSYWIESSNLQMEAQPDQAQPIEPLVQDLQNITAIEKELIFIWKDVLGVDSVNPDDNFFDIGGDSLFALQVNEKITQKIGIHLSLNNYIKTPTIKTFAKAIAQEKKKDILSAKTTETSLLISLNQGNEHELPIFLPAPVGGYVLFYNDFARTLDNEYPIYGLQAQGLDGKKEPLTSIESIASNYIGIIKTVQAKGPYRLMGSSFGGTVAFEMARQLKSQGEEIALLALVDSPDANDLPTKSSESERVIPYLAPIINYLLKSNVSFGGNKELIQKLRNMNTEELTDYLFNLEKDSSSLEAEMKQFHYLLKVYRANYQAMLDYSLKKYPGHLVYFRAQERRAKYDPKYPERAWVEIAEDGIDIHIIPGDHETINFLPHVKILTKKLKKYLTGIEPDLSDFRMDF